MRCETTAGSVLPEGVLVATKTGVAPQENDLRSKIGETGLIMCAKPAALPSSEGIV